MKLFVTERIYGPGPTRHSRVLLARPGRAYLAGYVEAVTGGDKRLISRVPTSVAVPSDPLDLSEIRAAKAARTVVVEEAADASAAPVTGGVVVEEGPEPDSTVNLGRLRKADLLEVAAERGVDLSDLGGKPTNEQIIGALLAAADDDEAGDSDAEGASDDGAGA